MRPILLKSDRFTSRQRTPWAGDRIIRKYKSELFPERIGESVGESWEFSCDPEMPSILMPDGIPLPAWVEQNARQVFSASALAAGKVSVEILVKLVDTADVMSLQIHPSDTYAHLKANECGKPESWLVLDAEPGAGFYLGFSRRVTKDELRAAFLMPGDAAKELLHFVPVKPGEYFEIEPGTPHAIGKGVTLLEPQRVIAGKSGKTYRFWDWGRKYLADGGRAAAGDVQGKGRELHLEDALRLVDPERQIGDAYAQSLKRSPARRAVGSGLLEWFPSNGHYRVGVMSWAVGQGELNLRFQTGYCVIIVLHGSIELESDDGSQSAQAGHSVLLPHESFPVRVRSVMSHSKIAMVIPAWAEDISEN